MSVEIIIVFAVIILAIIIFSFELLPIDVTAFSIMVTLMITGIISPQQGVMGFSNQATLTVLALMILGVGLEQTGAVGWMGRHILPLLTGKSWVATGILMVIVAFVSTFIATTAVVVIFLRILVEVSGKIPTHLSKLLIPLSFAGILGGSCSLMGTSTNLLVSSISKDFGYEPFGLFEFTWIGVIFFAAALIYMLVLGRHLIPVRQMSEELTEDYQIKAYITPLLINPDSPLIDKMLANSIFYKTKNLDVLYIMRKGRQLFPVASLQLEANDVIYAKADKDTIKSLYEIAGLSIGMNREELDGENQKHEEMVLCEILILPNSKMMGKSLDRIKIQKDFDIIPLAVHSRNKYITYNLELLDIGVGDTVLLETPKRDLHKLHNRKDIIVLQDIQDIRQRNPKRYLAFGIILLVILLAALNILPIMLSALTGCLLMFLTGCLEIRDAYRQVDWSIFFLLAGMIPLGAAMSNTGADVLLADTFISFFQGYNVVYFIGAIFILTTLLSGFISNNATAILIAPIVISIAAQMALPVKPFLLTVMFAANFSFFTPIGYQTHLLIYGPGNYRFKDFLVVGGILTVILCVLATLIISNFYF